MNLLDMVYAKAKENPQKVAFPEAANEKMMQAAYETGRDGYIIPILVGDEEELRALAKERGQSLPQMALSWLLKDSDVTSVLIGASKPEQILSNIGIIGHTTFTKEELDLIDQISKEQ